MTAFWFTWAFTSNFFFFLFVFANFKCLCLLCRFTHPAFDTKTFMFTPPEGATDADLKYQIFQSEIMINAIENGFFTKKSTPVREITPNMLAAAYTAVYVINKGITTQFSNEKKQESFQVFSEIYSWLQAAEQKGSDSWKKVVKFYQGLFESWNARGRGEKAVKAFGDRLGLPEL